ncbi:alpha/beta fold hydrolase [Mesobacterium pallidum]|uniref:alpha/beta fold hydrolase n=1 Tax=Mesobacterium pallidum TaxID=2872037 RepID=UPI001EE32735|nr:alpha/beta fold hydrolase [Mesobacterium pallidum]
MDTRLDLNGLSVGLSDTGAGAPVLFLHGLGQDRGLWDGVTGALPEGLRCLAPDLRGHGATDAPAPPYAMGALVRDAESLLDTLGLKDAVVVGHGLGGMVAMALAVKRLDLVRGLVLSATAPKLSTPARWARHAETVAQGGIGAIAAETVTAWFNRPGPLAQLWSARLKAMSPDGYLGGVSAISGTDLYTPASGLRLSTLVISGRDDRAIPPDLSGELATLIPGATLTLIPRAGHMAPVEAATDWAEALTEFLRAIGHL